MFFLCELNLKLVALLYLVEAAFIFVLNLLATA